MYDTWCNHCRREENGQYLQSLLRNLTFLLFCCAFIGTASTYGAAIENAALRVEYDPSPSVKSITITNRQTTHSFIFSTACPVFMFKEGKIGGPSILPVRITNRKVKGGRELVMRYPVQHLGDRNIWIETVYVIPARGVFIRKYATLKFESTDNRNLTLEKVILLDEPLPGRVVYAQEGWQSYPVFTDECFYGVEFPAANAAVRDGRILLSHAPGKVLEPMWPWRTRDAIIGFCEEGRVAETFRAYVDSFRPQQGVHFNYNSWWTSSVPFTEQEILGIIEEFDNNLYKSYGVSFDSFTIDMGWSAREGIWKIDPKLFPNGFTPLRDALARQNSRLGLWWSPSNHYTPSSFDNQWARKAGYETFEQPWINNNPLRLMCLARGTCYQEAAKQSLLDITKDSNLGQLKCDGYTPQCPEGNHGHLPGELSHEILAEGIIDILQTLRKARPDLWIEPTCFGYDASPWWLRYADSVIGCFGDDAPPGAVPAPDYRESYTTSRDFFNLHSINHPIPIAAQEVHGIVHQTQEPLYNDAVVTVLRGHQFISLYINPKFMTPEEYRFLAQLMTWAKVNSDLLSHTRILLPRAWREHGLEPVGNLRNMPRETYGYAHWYKGEGLVCLRNPWMAAEGYALKLDAETLVYEKSFRDYAAWQIYPYPLCLGSGLRSGDTLNITMGSYQTRVIRILQDRRAIPAPDPIVNISAGMKILDASSNLVQIVYDDVPIEIYTDNSTVLSASQAVVWESAIKGQCGAGEMKLYYLIESPEPVLVTNAFIQVNGTPAAIQVLDSAAGWSASQPAHFQNNWKWFVAAVPAGSWVAKASFEIQRRDAQVSVWLSSFSNPALFAQNRFKERHPDFPLPPDNRMQSSISAIPHTSVSEMELLTRHCPVKRETIPGIYLDRLVPVIAEQGWGQLQKNKSVWEKPMQIGSRQFLRGIGTHANAKIVYVLDARYKAFHGFAGQDAATNGSVAFEIRVDGVKRWESGRITRAEEAKEFHVSVDGARVLTLIVTDSGDGITADHADWANAWLEYK